MLYLYDLLHVGANSLDEYGAFDMDTKKKVSISKNKLCKLIDAGQVAGCKATTPEEFESIRDPYLRLHIGNRKYRLKMYDLREVCEKWLNRLNILCGTKLRIHDRDENYSIELDDIDVRDIRLEGNKYVYEIPPYVNLVSDTIREKFQLHKDYCLKVIYKGDEDNPLNYIESMSGLFEEQEHLGYDLSEFSTRGCRDINSMFIQSVIHSSLDLTSFDTSKVECVTFMFGGAQIYGDLDLSSFELPNVHKESIYLFGFVNGSVFRRILILRGGKVLLSHKQSDETLNKIIEAAKYGDVPYAFKD